MPAVSAALIVRDEATRIRSCLVSLAGLVDEIVVYDTGSSDNTRELAAELGARVITGYWDDDFARARNAVLAHCAADWVLSVDADETASGDRSALLDAIGRAEREGHALLGVPMHITNAAEHGGQYRAHLPRLFRRTGAGWIGRVHERVQHDGDTSGAGSVVPTVCADALELVHLGYQDPAVVRAKAARNLGLGLAEVAALQQGDDAHALAVALLDVGRSLVGVGRVAEALDPFADVRALSPVGSALWCQATDFLARQNLALGNDQAALNAAQELVAAAPQHADYGRWLLAQAMVQLGLFRGAADVLAAVHVVVDPAGRELDAARVEEFRGLLRQLLSEDARQRAVLG